jgi:hypothetical protein
MRIAIQKDTRQVVSWANEAIASLAATRRDTREGWLHAAPLALYAGWLTAAAWVSVGLMLGGFGITSNVIAAWIALAGAAVTATVVQRRTPRAPLYGLAVAWALVAVAVRNADNSLPLTAAAALGAAAIAALALGPVLRR